MQGWLSREHRRRSLFTLFLLHFHLSSSMLLWTAHDHIFGHMFVFFKNPFLQRTSFIIHIRLCLPLFHLVQFPWPISYYFPIVGNLPHWHCVLLQEAIYIMSLFLCHRKAFVTLFVALGDIQSKRDHIWSLLLIWHTQLCVLRASRLEIESSPLGEWEFWQVQGTTAGTSTCQRPEAVGMTDHAVAYYYKPLPLIMHISFS